MLRVTLFALLLAAAGCKNDDPKPKQEEWLLMEKRRFDYKLDEKGRPDTTFVYISRYKDGLVTDSSKTFQVSRYNGDLISQRLFYRFDKDNNPVHQLTTDYEFTDGSQLASLTQTMEGKLVKREVYSYGPDKMPSKYMLIQSRTKVQSPEEIGATGDPTVDPAAGYDTLMAIYKFDTAKRVVGTLYTDLRGNPYRSDVNIYSGSDPLKTYSTDAKGDTIQQISYEKSGRLLHTKTENDSFILYQNIAGTIPVSQLTHYKKSNERWKTSATFDVKGRKTEEKMYKVGFSK